MKVNLEDIHLGVSGMTKTVYAFIPDKEGNAKHKQDVTEGFKAVCAALGYEKRIKVIDEDLSR